MATNGPNPQQSTDENLKAIRVHLLHIRRTVGILVWLAAAGLLLAIALALSTVA